MDVYRVVSIKSAKFFCVLFTILGCLNCATVSGQQWTVGGNIQIATSGMNGGVNPGQLGLEGAIVDFQGMPQLPAGACKDVATQPGGHYECTFPAGGMQQVVMRPYTISTASTNNCGVDFDDMCWMQSFIVFQTTGGSSGCNFATQHWSSVLAADCDQSGHISGVDVVMVRDMILGWPPLLPAPSYFFYPQSIDMDMQLEYQAAGGFLGGFGYHDFISTASPGEEYDFYAVKVGDPISSCTSTTAFEGDLPKAEFYGDDALESVPVYATVRNHAIVLEPDIEKGHMLSFSMDLGRHAESFDRVSSNLDFSLETSYSFEGSVIKVVVFAEKEVDAPEVILHFGGKPELSFTDFELVQLQDIPNMVWSIDGALALRMMPSAITVTNNDVVMINDLSRLRYSLPDGVIRVYDVAGMLRHHGSLTTIGTLTQGLYIYVGEDGVARRFYLSQ